MDKEQLRALTERIKTNISQVIVGKDEVIEKVLISLFCGGHVLLEDVPGLGKTMLAKTLSRSISCDMKRIQFTPDLLPSDLTGIYFFNQAEGDFTFRPGPIFGNIILADEVNRATPRTQSSLLECMEEKQVTVDGNTMILKSPFFVIATQNPVEIQGTFPLPEAQLDRFFMRLHMGYPTAGESKAILDRFQNSNPLPSINPVTTAGEIIEAQESFLDVVVSDAVKNYIIKITEETRRHEKIVLGVSPRGSISLMKACQCYAAIHNRDYVLPDDVKYLAKSVFSHRMVLKGHAVTTIKDASESILDQILEKVPVPLENIIEGAG